MQQWFNWLLNEDEIDAHPMARMKPPTIPEKEVPLVPLDLIRKILADCDGRDLISRRDTAIIRLISDTACRLSEIDNLTMDDFDLDLDVIHVVGKGRRPRSVPFSPKIGQALEPNLTLLTVVPLPVGLELGRSCDSRASLPVLGAGCSVDLDHSNPAKVSMIQDIATVVTAVGVVVAVLPCFPTAARAPVRPKMSLNADDEKVIRAYIRLCEDQLEPRKAGWVSDSSWTIWAEGMRLQFQRWAYDKVWQKVNHEATVRAENYAVREYVLIRPSTG